MLNTIIAYTSHQENYFFLCLIIFFFFNLSNLQNLSQIAAIQHKTIKMVHSAEPRQNATLFYRKMFWCSQNFLIRISLKIPHVNVKSFYYFTIPYRSSSMKHNYLYAKIPFKSGVEMGLKTHEKMASSFVVQAMTRRS